MHARTIGLFVALCILSGPGPQVEKAFWQRATVGARHRQSLLEHRKKKVHTVGQLPPWAARVFNMSEVRLHHRLGALLDRCRNDAGRFCHLVFKAGGNGDHKTSGATGAWENVVPRLSDGKEDDAEAGSYFLTGEGKHKAFQRIVVKKLALPPVGHRAVDLLGNLPWPYCEMVSRLGECKISRAEVQAKGPVPVCRNYLAEGENYGALLLRLEQSGMVRFVPPSKAPPGPTAGLFAVAKGEDRQRLIVDARAGNHEWCSDRLQDLWVSVLASQPERSASLGLTERNLMGLPSPETLTHLPAGGFAVGLTDKANYYYTVLQLEVLLGCQRLRPVAGHRVGRKADRLVPVLVCCAMGQAHAALLTNWLHIAVAGRLARGETPLRLPSAQTDARRQMVRRLREQADREGRVGGAELKPFLPELRACGFAGLERLPPTVRVPWRALSLQPLAQAEARVSSNQDLILLLGRATLGRRRRSECSLPRWGGTQFSFSDGVGLGEPLY